MSKNVSHFIMKLNWLFKCYLKINFGIGKTLYTLDLLSSYIFSCILNVWPYCLLRSTLNCFIIPQLMIENYGSTQWGTHRDYLQICVCELQEVLPSPLISLYSPTLGLVLRSSTFPFFAVALVSHLIRSPLSSSPAARSQGPSQCGLKGGDRHFGTKRFASDRISHRRITRRGWGGRRGTSANCCQPEESMMPN